MENDQRRKREDGEQGAERTRSSPWWAPTARRSLQRLVDSLNFKRLGNQAMVLRDKVQQNPKAAAGIALALAGSIWAISRSVSASRRRKRTITKVLAAVGLWRTLAPMLRAARRKGPKLQRAGLKRLDRAGDLLKHNAGPFFERTLPLAGEALRALRSGSRTRPGRARWPPWRNPRATASG